MKINNLIVLYPSFERGGATSNLINFINESIKKNISINLISNLTEKNKRKIFPNKLKLFKINAFSRFLTSIISLFFLIKLLFKFRSKKIIVISFQSHILPIIICNIFFKKIVIRNSEEISNATKFADNKISAYFIYFLKVVTYNFANGIITNSHKAKKSLEKILFNKRKIRLIYNPYLKSILPITKNKRKNYLLSVGRLTKQKNQILLIKSFNLFLKHHPNYKLIFIGHGPDKLKLMSLTKKLNLENKIIFKNWMSNPKEYYKHSKLFLFPSLYEGLPNALIDAVNYNLPSVSSDCSGASDILTYNYKNIVKKLEPKIFSQKILDSINNYQESLRSNKKIRSRLSNFLIYPQVNKYLDFCQLILNK